LPFRFRNEIHYGPRTVHSQGRVKPLPFRDGAIARGEYACLTIFGRTAFFGIDCSCSKEHPHGWVQVIMALLSPEQRERRCGPPGTATAE